MHLCIFECSDARAQVLDDSTDPETRARVAEAVADWTEQGVRIEQRLREKCAPRLLS